MNSSLNPPPKNLPVLAIRGTLWAYLSFIFGKVLTFASTVILARLLAPEQFGVVGYCLIALQYLEILSDFAMDGALVARRDKLEEAANAAFVINLASSLLMFGAAWVAAPYIAGFFQESAVTDLLRALVLTLPISALAIVPGALLRREMRFKLKFIPDVSRSLAKGLFSIVLAWQGFGVWSLVWGPVAGETVSALITWLLVRWRPTFKFDSQVTREMMGIGFHLILVGIMGALLANVDYLIVGKVLGAAALGFYVLAYRIPELIISNTLRVIGGVALPLVARSQTDLRSLHRVFFAYLRYIALFAFPVSVGLALTAPPFIRIFYTVKWEPAIAVMQSIAVAIGIGSMGFLPGVIYKAINRPDVLNRFSLIKLPVTIGILWYCTRWGINGVAVGQILVAALNLTLTLLLAYWVIKIHPYEVLKTALPALGSSLIMGGMIAGGMLLLNPSNVLVLAFWVASGAAVYVAALTVTSRDTVTQAITVLRATFSRS